MGDCEVLLYSSSQEKSKDLLNIAAGLSAHTKKKIYIDLMQIRSKECDFFIVLLHCLASSRMTVGVQEDNKLQLCWYVAANKNLDDSTHH